MALLWVDGFDNIGTLNDSVVTLNIDRRYTSLIQSGALVGDGVASVGTSLQIRSNSYVCTPPLTTNRYLYTGFNYYASTNVTANNPIVCLYSPVMDGGNSRYAELGLWNYGGNAVVYLGDVAIATTNTAPLVADAWQHIELGVYCDQTAGWVIVNIDGVETINYSGNDTQFQILYDYYAIVCLRTEVVKNHRYDNFYVCDGSGSTCNTFLGQCKVITMRPGGDVSGNWTANSGSDKYAMLNSTGFGTTNYIKESTTGNRQLFSYSGNVAGGTILGVSVQTDVIDSANTNKGLKVLSQNGSGSVVTSNAFPVYNVCAGTSKVFETDADGNAFTQTTLNDAHYGVEVA